MGRIPKDGKRRSNLFLNDTIEEDDYGGNETVTFTNLHDNTKRYKSGSPRKLGLCRVCGKQATGINFGIDTCEGCKVRKVKCGSQREDQFNMVKS